MILRGPGLAADIECWNPECPVKEENGKTLRASKKTTTHDVTLGFTDVTNVAPDIECPECRAITRIEKGRARRRGFAGLTNQHRTRERAIIHEGALPGVIVDIDDTAHDVPPDEGEEEHLPTPSEGSTQPPEESASSTPSFDSDDPWYNDLEAKLREDPERHTNYHATLSKKGLPCPECGPDNDWLDNEDGE